MLARSSREHAGRVRLGTEFVSVKSSPEGGVSATAIAIRRSYVVPESIGPKPRRRDVIGIVYGVALGMYVPLRLWYRAGAAHKAAAVAVLNRGAGRAKSRPLLAGLVGPRGIAAVVWILAGLYVVGFAHDLRLKTAPRVEAGGRRIARKTIAATGPARRAGSRAPCGLTPGTEERSTMTKGMSTTIVLASTRGDRGEGRARKRTGAYWARPTAQPCGSSTRTKMQRAAEQKWTSLGAVARDGASRAGRGRCCRGRGDLREWTGRRRPAAIEATAAIGPAALWIAPGRAAGRALAGRGRAGRR